MKYLKMLGLAAVAAAALMAFVGAGTASADELCTQTPVNKMCPEGTQITTITGSQIGTGTLETTGGSTLITCKGSHIHIDITDQGTGKDISGTITELTWSECSGTVNTLVTGTTTGNTVSHSSGTLTAKKTEVTTGILGTTCTYGAGEGTDIGTTNNTELVISAIVKKTAGSFLCPSEARWTTAYKITNHTTVDWA